MFARLKCWSGAAQTALLPTTPTHLSNVLALKLRDELANALLVRLDADGVEELLDVSSRRRSVAAEGEEEVGCEELHF